MVLHSLVDTTWRTKKQTIREIGSHGYLSKDSSTDTHADKIIEK